MKELIVGIDLGTTNSALAIPRESAIEMLYIQQQPTLPSCVGLDEAGRIIVGQPAKNQLIAAPDSTILSVKRRMGENVRLALGDKTFTPEEISSFILRELKQQAERQWGQSIEKAVITVPAFFNESQRKATQAAGALAGLDVLRIINEPTAAALAYGAGKTADETLLVYDLGGGTFDVSVVVVEKGVLEVKASHGDTHLGGDDFDDLLVQQAITEFKNRHGVDLNAHSSALRRLKLVLERAKCRLSDEPVVQVREEYLDGKNHLEMEILRTDYEARIESWIERTLVCLHRSLEDARLSPAQIDKVMLVGGSTRTPLVHRMLSERIGKEPRWEINPDLIVAMGAAVQAGIIGGQTQHSVLVDITPHTYGTSSLGRFEDGLDLVSVPIIRRNTPLPASKSELFYTAVDRQPSVRVDAHQGEDLIPSNNTPIGEFLVEGLSPVPQGNPVLIHFDLDLNGILKVTATEKMTGLAKTVTMDTHGKQGIDMAAARKNIASLIGDLESDPTGQDEGETELDSSPEELLTTAKDLKKRGEAFIEKRPDHEDSPAIRQIIHESAEAIAARNWITLDERSQALMDLLFYLED